MCLNFVTYLGDNYIQNVHLGRYIVGIQQNQMRISAYFPDVSSKYYFEYHSDFQDCELKSEIVTFNDGFNGKYEKHKNIKKRR